MKQFLGKTQTRKVKFMDGEVKVKLLTVGDARAIEDATKTQIGLPEEKQDQLAILRFVMRLAVVGAEELTDEEFDQFPVTELTRLSEEIMGGFGQAGND
jgi:hypothetical protein